MSCLALGVTVPAAAVETDPALTRSLREQAAAYEHGEGVPKDPARAVMLYCQAARLGDAQAQYALGWMFANGRGVPRDDSLATGLFGLSAAQGHRYAQRMLTFVNVPDARTPDCMRPTPIATAEGRDEASVAIYERDLSGKDLAAGLPPHKQRLADLVRKLAPHYGVEPRLALALIRVESNFDSRARSSKNAQGLMQLIPETAERFNVRNTFDPAENIRGGLKYLRWLLAYYQGRVALAAAAYNAGEGVVDRYRGVPPYKETQEYVRRILMYFRAEQHPYDERVVNPSPAFF
ncbi:MAG: transglycosylase SLT domain-containing protein [Betaproteobacteria bacterium]|nr:transglycosylase SLT domain-containing protein [Betaproteobacteria bacterium]